MLTLEELQALRLGQPLVDERGITWVVACLLMAGHVGVRQGDHRYRMIGKDSGFRLKGAAE